MSHADLLAGLKAPALVELLDALAKHGTELERKAAARARSKNARRASILELAARARRRRRVHVASLGFAFCKVEGGRDTPGLLERLITSTTTIAAEVTCAKCQALIGGELEAGDQAEEDAEVAAAELQAEMRRRREELAAARAQAVEVEPVAEVVPAVELEATPTPIGLDDGHGTELTDPIANLAVCFPYKGTNHVGYLRADGRLELEAGGETFPSPSAAGGSITGGAVNGWRRWRYEARDGQTYPIGRLRGDAVAAVRSGVTGRRPSAATAIARHAAAEAKAAKALARLAKARALVLELEAKHAEAAAEVAGLAAAAIALGAELGDDSDLFPEAEAAA
jgi:hypothetical protein